MPEFVKIELDPKSQQGLKEIRERWSRGSLLEFITTAFDKLAALAAGFIIQDQLSGDPLHRRTGNLARSLVGRGETYNGLPAIRVGIFRGPAASYATILEFGGTIVPKNAKALAIPTDKVQTDAGVSQIAGPRDYKSRYGNDLVYIPFRRGISVGALYDEAELKANKGKLDGLTPAYWLVTQVTIPAFHYLLNGMTKFVPQMSGLLKTMIIGYLNGKDQ